MLFFMCEALGLKLSACRLLVRSTRGGEHAALVYNTYQIWGRVFFMVRLMERHFYCLLIREQLCNAWLETGLLGRCSSHPASFTWGRLASIFVRV